MVPQDSTMYLSWSAIGVICGILTLVITTVGRVLQNSIKTAIVDSQAILEKRIEERFSSKESVAGKLELLNLRMSHIEDQLKDIKEGRMQHSQ